MSSGLLYREGCNVVLILEFWVVLIKSQIKSPLLKAKSRQALTADLC